MDTLDAKFTWLFVGDFYGPNSLPINRVETPTLTAKFSH